MRKYKIGAFFRYLVINEIEFQQSRYQNGVK